MTTVRDIATRLEGELEGARLNKSTRARVANLLGGLRSSAGNLSVYVDTVGGYGDEDDRDPVKVYPRVRPVHINAGDNHGGGWYPRVELRLERDTVAGDLTKEQAIALATELLQAASKLG